MSVRFAGGALSSSRGVTAGKDRIFINELDICLHIEKYGIAHRVPLLVDIDLFASATPASISDDVKLTLDYSAAAVAARTIAATGFFPDLDAYRHCLDERLSAIFPDVPVGIRLWPNGHLSPV